MSTFPFIFLFFILFVFRVQAQHCAFDLAYIIVVHVQSAEDSSLIEGLKITIADSSGRSVVSHHPAEHHCLDDTLRFWENPVKTTHCPTINDQHPMEPWTIRFWFAKNNYVYVTGPTPPGAFIKIEDPDGNAHGGSFETMTTALSKTELYPLCSLYSQWRNGAAYGFVEDYKAICVRLIKK
jgi:hypothetical protein